MRYVEIGWIVRIRRARNSWRLGAGLRARSYTSARPDRACPAELVAALHAQRGRTGGDRRNDGVSSARWSSTTARSGCRTAKSLQNLQLLRVLAPSTEEQRLTDLYKTKGLNALIEELNKF